MFDDAIREVWMFAMARRKAAWEARVAALTSGCTNHFAGEGQRSTIQMHQAALAHGSDRGGHVLDGADTSSTSGSSGGSPVIDVSSGDEWNV
jgi:hypothetical protein